MNISAWKAVILSAAVLAGCDAAPQFQLQDDATPAAAVNPYPPGEASPMFFRSAAQWQQYAAVHSAAADARHGD